MGSRTVTRLVDLDTPSGLELLWQELQHRRAIREADPPLREAIIRRCEQLDPTVAAPILGALDSVHPGVVAESYFTILVPDKSTIGAIPTLPPRSVMA